MTEKERELILDLCALLETYMGKRTSWDGWAEALAKVTLKEAEELFYLTLERLIEEKKAET